LRLEQSKGPETGAAQWSVVSTLICLPYNLSTSASYNRLQLEHHQPQHDFSSQLEPQFISHPEELRIRRITAESTSPPKSWDPDVATSGWIVAE
jgi:hypothetical protein